MRSAVAGAGILACLVLVTFSALMGFIGHSSGGHSHHHEPVVSVGHEIPVAGSEPISAGRHHEAPVTLHWEHDSLSTLGIASPAAGVHANTSSAGFVSSADSASCISGSDGAGLLSPTPYLLCVLRT